MPTTFQGHFKDKSKQIHKTYSKTKDKPREVSGAAAHTVILYVILNTRKSCKIMRMKFFPAHAHINSARCVGSSRTQQFCALLPLRSPKMPGISTSMWYYCTLRGRIKGPASAVLSIQPLNIKGQYCMAHTALNIKGQFCIRVCMLIWSARVCTEERPSHARKALPELVSSARTCRRPGEQRAWRSGPSYSVARTRLPWHGRALVRWPTKSTIN